MKLTVEKALELGKKSRALKTDLDLLQFAKENYDFICVTLDNDSSWLDFKTDGLDEEVEEIICDIELPQFDNYHGWGEGNILLFRFAGIDSESC